MLVPPEWVVSIARLAARTFVPSFPLSASAAPPATPPAAPPVAAPVNPLVDLSPVADPITDVVEVVMEEGVAKVNEEAEEDDDNVRGVLVELDAVTAELKAGEARATDVEPVLGKRARDGLKRRGDSKE